MNVPMDLVPCGGMARESHPVTYMLKWLVVLHTSISFCCRKSSNRRGEKTGAGIEA